MSVIELSSLSLFYSNLKKAPKLSREEEYSLANAWQKKEDYEAAQKLVIANLRSVAAIARQYRHFGLQEMDLIQEGTLGLMKAVKKFDPSRGFRLSTYASWWIKAEINEFVLHSWSIVKLGTNKVHRKIFSGLQKAKNAIAAIDGTHAEEVAKDFNLTSQEYRGITSMFLDRDTSIDMVVDGQSMSQNLESDIQSPEQIVEIKQDKVLENNNLSNAMSKLSSRDAYIIQRRKLQEDPETLKALSEELGVSIERVRQLENRAFDKLKETMLTDED